MEDLYKHIESLGKEHGYKNMTVLCKAAGVPRSTMSELNNGRSKDLSKPNPASHFPGNIPQMNPEMPRKADMPALRRRIRQKSRRNKKSAHPGG